MLGEALLPLKEPSSFWRDALESGAASQLLERHLKGFEALPKAWHAAVKFGGAS